jgi:hypothetical protein
MTFLRHLARKPRRDLVPPAGRRWMGPDFLKSTPERYARMAKLLVRLCCCLQTRKCLVGGQNRSESRDPYGVPPLQQTSHRHQYQVEHRSRLGRKGTATSHLHREHRGVPQSLLSGFPEHPARCGIYRDGRTRCVGAAEKANERAAILAEALTIIGEVGCEGFFLNQGGGPVGRISFPSDWIMGLKSARPNAAPRSNSMRQSYHPNAGHCDEMNKKE